MSRTEPLFLVAPGRELRPGDFITVDGRPSVVRKVLLSTGTVIRAEIEVYESAAERAKANPTQHPAGTLADEAQQLREAFTELGERSGVARIGEVCLGFLSKIARRGR